MWGVRLHKRELWAPKTFMILGQPYWIGFAFNIFVFAEIRTPIFLSRTLHGQPSIWAPEIISTYAKAASFKKTTEEVKASNWVEQVISKVTSLALEQGTNPEVVESVFRAMISAFI